MPQEKFQALLAVLSQRNSSLIAYSGGVDSTFLVKAAQSAGIRFLAVTSSSETVPPGDLARAQKIARELGIEHRVIRTSEMECEAFVENPPDRCFHCKDILFNHLQVIASDEGYAFILDGSNSDDLNDYRPGLKANRKHGVFSPLIEAGLGKEEIRELSRGLGLSIWNAPSSPCLSSRFPYGTLITEKGLAQVSRGESFLKSLGFRVVRVRNHNSVATIEVGTDELWRIMRIDIREQIMREFERIGFVRTCIDTEGYRPGKLNRSLDGE